MTATDKSLSDLLTIRDYLRDRRDDLHKKGFCGDAQVLGEEIDRLNKLIAKAEAATKL